MANKNYYAKIRREIIDAVPAHVSRILSVGCGSGATEAVLKSQGKIIYGIEKESSLKDRLARNLNHYSVADLDDGLTNLPADFFDCVIFADILEHLKKPQQILNDAKLLSKSHACFIISIPNIGHASVIKNLLLGRWNYQPAGIMDESHLRFFTLNSFKKIIAEQNFTTIGIRRKFKPLPEENARHRFTQRLYYYFNRLFNLKINPLLYLPWLREFFVYQYLFILKKND